MLMSRAANSVVSGPIWLKFELVPDFMHGIKSNQEKVETSFSPSQWEGLSVAMETSILIQSAPKPYAAFPLPHGDTIFPIIS